MEVSLWQILTAVATIASAFALVKYQAIENKRQFELHDAEQKRMVESFFNKLDKHSEELVELRTKQEANITAKEVQSQYISRELFEMHKQHIDHRFDSLDNRFDKVDGAVGKILEELKRINS